MPRWRNAHVTEYAIARYLDVNERQLHDRSLKINIFEKFLFNILEHFLREYETRKESVSKQPRPDSEGPGDFVVGDN